MLGADNFDSPSTSRMKQAVNKTTTFLSNLPRIKAHSHFRSFLCTNNCQYNILLLKWTTSLKQAGYDKPRQNIKCTKTTDKKFSLCFFFFFQVGLFNFIVFYFEVSAILQNIMEPQLTEFKLSEKCGFLHLRLF